MTPKSQIVSGLRRTWLRSRERAARLKHDQYTCVRCGAKQSRAKGREVKVEVHHKEPIEWDSIVAVIKETLLVDSTETLCQPCHKKE